MAHRVAGCAQYSAFSTTIIYAERTFRVWHENFATSGLLSMQSGLLSSLELCIYASRPSFAELVFPDHSIRAERSMMPVPSLCEMELMILSCVYSTELWLSELCHGHGPSRLEVLW